MEKTKTNETDAKFGIGSVIHRFSFTYNFGYMTENRYKHYPIIWFAKGSNGFTFCVIGATITVKY